MSVLESLGDRIKAQVGSPVLALKSKILGMNNERIDFIMDSFYKLSQSQRMGVVSGIIGVVVFFLFLSIVLFFSQVSGLKREWDQSIMALKELERNRQELEIESRAFEQVVTNISGKASSFRIKPFLDAKTKEANVQMENITESTNPMSTDDPLGERFNEVKAEVRVGKVSLPRLVKLLVDVESSGNYLRVEALDIRGRHENKLFFDLKTRIRGYALK